MIIAIDGPAGAGKSTIAKALAKEYSIDYIDTGAMYRAIALKLLKTGINYRDEAALNGMLNKTDVDYTQGKTYLDGEDVSNLIRSPEITSMASLSSAVPLVRYKLTELQQSMGRKKSLVMDGRDIGTVVFPGADYKFFLTASADERARRRTDELLLKGENADFEGVKADIEKRDYQDSTRAFRPLKQAADAILIDTTGLDIEEVINEVKTYIR